MCFPPERSLRPFVDLDTELHFLINGCLHFRRDRSLKRSSQLTALLPVTMDSNIALSQKETPEKPLCTLLISLCSMLAILKMAGTLDCPFDAFARAMPGIWAFEGVFVSSRALKNLCVNSRTISLNNLACPNYEMLWTHTPKLYAYSVCSTTSQV